MSSAACVNHVARRAAPARRIASMWIGRAAARAHPGALDWLEREANEGDPIAMTHLAILYRHARAMPDSASKARYWCERAACMGHVPAMLQLLEWHTLDAGHVIASAWGLIALRFAKHGERRFVRTSLQRIAQSSRREDWLQARSFAIQMIAMIRALRYSAPATSGRFLRTA